MRSLTFFAIIFKERKKERIMGFMACHIKKIKKRKQTS